MPIAVDHGHWFVALKDKESPIPYDELWHYYTYGDTIVGDIAYKKVYMQLADTFCAHNPPYEPFGPIDLAALIRDDIENKIVYAISIQEPFYSDCPQNEEYVLYDFSQKVGDTVYSCLFDWYYNSKEITMIESGTKFGIDTRIFSVGSATDSYYEGIGSLYGLLEGFFYPVDKKGFMYYTYLFNYCRTDECEMIVNTNETGYNEASVFISPNPAKDHLFVRILKDEQIKVKAIECYDLPGQKIKGIKLDGSPIHQIDTQSWSKGLYIIRIIFENNIVISEKIIIN